MTKEFLTDWLDGVEYDGNVFVADSKCTPLKTVFSEGWSVGELETKKIILQADLQCDENGENCQIVAVSSDFPNVSYSS